MQHIQTGHIPSHWRGCYNVWKCGYAIRVSSHHLRPDEHLDGTKTSRPPLSGGRTSIHHDTSPQWKCNSSGEHESKNNDHSSVYGALITGSRMGGADCALGGVELGLGLPSFQSMNPDVNWQCGQLSALKTTRGAEVLAVDWLHHQERPVNEPGLTAQEEACSEWGCSIPDIHILAATAFDNLLASE